MKFLRPPEDGMKKWAVDDDSQEWLANPPVNVELIVSIEISATNRYNYGDNRWTNETWNILFRGIEHDIHWRFKTKEERDITYNWILRNYTYKTE